MREDAVLRKEKDHVREAEKLGVTVVSSATRGNYSAYDRKRGSLSNKSPAICHHS